MKISLSFFVIILAAGLSSKAQTHQGSGVKVSEQSIIAARAKKWFKEVYVASTFKDPYSYKLLKFSILPVTFSTEAKSDLEDAENNIQQAKETLSKIDTVTIDAAFKVHDKDLKRLKEDYDSNLKLYGDQDQATRSSLRKYNDQYMTVHKDTVGLYEANAALSTYSKIKQKLLTVKSRDVMYYYIDIDCYGNNSYGGRILGSYFFKFNKNGLIGEVTQRER